MKYVIYRKVCFALCELAENGGKVIDTAYKYGFESSDVFTRCCKRYFGRTPAVIRKSHSLETETPVYISPNIYYERLRNMKTLNKERFDWNKAACSYARFRNIYPGIFWQTLHNSGIGEAGQNILDIGTGTGILPMNMQKYGGNYTGIDISENMTEQAKKLDKTAEFFCADAHNMPFDTGSFDIVTALQCWVYFDKERLIPEICRILKPDGKLYVMFLTWLPEEDNIISKTFRLTKKYNPHWSGYMKRTEYKEPYWVRGNFKLELFEKFDVKLPFTRDEWCGRMLASRGVGAALDEEKCNEYISELHEFLCGAAEEKFTVLHEAVIMKFGRI